MHNFFSVIVLSLLPLSIVAQVTITRTDVENAYINSQWFGVDDTAGGSFNLGTASSSAQTWNFSGLIINNPTVDRDTLNYVPAAGHLRFAEDFPTADICVTVTQQQSGGGYTLTFTSVQYFAGEDDGGYALGYAANMHVTPTPPPGFPYPEDSTYVEKFRPASLGFPLPLTLGTSRTASDTINSGNDVEINNKEYNANGFGTMVMPDGRSLQVIRMIEDREELEINEDNEVTRERHRYVIFIASDLSALEFVVDTTYTGGVTTVRNVNYQWRGGPLSVKEVNNTVPSQFALSQNYPNPFNPSTKIQFSVAETRFVTLKVYNVIGQEVATLVESQLAPGTYEATWNAGAAASGLYLYRLTTGEITETRSMILLR